LPDDVRTQLATIIDEETAKGNALSKQLDTESRQKILDTGGVIRELTPEQRAAWSKAMEPVWAEFEGDIGADLINAAKDSNLGS
jgi:C4-dicarboxylate-binding protein DctP